MSDFMDLVHNEQPNSLSSHIIDKPNSLSSHKSDKTVSFSPAQPDSNSSSATASIYHQNNSNNNEELRLTQKHIKQQKCLVVSHAIFLLLVSAISLPLLMRKEKIVNDYYDNDAQCCYCLWIGHISNATDGHKIAWSPCVDKTDLYNYKSSDPNKCINHDDANKSYCSPFSSDNNYKHLSWWQWTKWERVIFQREEYSTTSSVLGLVKFHKWYPYYGIILIIVSSIYIIFLVIVTFISEKRLSVVLFIGNIILSITCYYTHIKCYQYFKENYDMMCPNPPPFNNNNVNPSQCYQSAIRPFFEFNLNLIVYFIFIYLLYPIILIIIFNPCKKHNVCVNFKNKIEYFLRYFGIIFGIYFVLMGCYIFSYIIIQRDTEFILLSESDWNINIPSGVEQGYVIFLCVAFLIFAFDVFLLDRCKQETKYILCGENHNRYVSLLSTFMTSTNDHGHDENEECRNAE